MVIEWIDPGIFRWIVIGIWFAAASRGLIVCGGNYHKARDRRKEFFRDGPESLRRGVIYRHRFQRKLFIAMCAAAAVGILAAILPRPIPLPPITLYSLLGNGLLLWFISLISGLSVDVRRYEAEVIEAQAAVDEGTLQGIAAQFTTNGGQSLRDVVDRLEKMLRRMEAGDVVVANNLVKDREMVHGVAVDLQASRADSAAARDRADAVPSDSDPGAAADAASQSGESSDP